MTVTPRGSHLRDLRRLRHLTQADLAARSGVSQRAIRSLESDRTHRPHPATLRALGRALGLSEVQAMTFARTFVAPAVADMSEVLGVSPLLLQDQLQGLHDAAHAANWTSDVYHCHQVVGADGHFELNRVHRVIRSTIENLTHVMCMIMYEYDVEAVPPVLDPFGVEVSQQWLLAEHRIAVIELALPRALGVGDTHAYGYTIDDSPPAAVRERTEPDCEVTEGSRGPVGTFALEVQFSGTAPAQIRPFAQRGADEHVRQFSEPVRPDETGTVRLQRQNVPPGQALGFSWSW